jgi:hypothetical protein
MQFRSGGPLIFTSLAIVPSLRDDIRDWPIAVSIASDRRNPL